MGASRCESYARFFSRRVKAEKVKQGYARISLAVRMWVFYRVRQTSANFVALLYLRGSLCGFDVELVLVIPLLYKFPLRIGPFWVFST